MTDNPYAHIDLMVEKVAAGLKPVITLMPDLYKNEYFIGKAACFTVAFPYDDIFGMIMRRSTDKVYQDLVADAMEISGQTYEETAKSKSAPAMAFPIWFTHMEHAVLFKLKYC